MNRRSVLKSSLAMLAGGALARHAEADEPAIKNVNHASSPSSAEDHRHALCGDRQAGAEPLRSDPHRHQPGVYGLGEVRDIAGPQYAHGARRAAFSARTR